MTTIDDLFAAAGVVRSGVVPWGEAVPLDAPGIYVVALTADATSDEGLRECPLDRAAVDELICERTEATVDGLPADAASLSRRLDDMWVPGQPAIYIGLAGGSVRDRIGQFYSTRIGARAPHAGGWPVKMLDQSLAPLWVHFGPSADPSLAEQAMAQHFVSGVPKAVAAALIDPDAPLPFANLTFPGGRRKRHGLSGVKASGTRQDSAVGAASRVVSSQPDAPSNSAERPAPRRRFTQRVTAGDVRAGQLRVPAVSKDIFPSTTSRITVAIGGQSHDVSWNPRTTGDRERSGVIRLGKAVMSDRFSPGAPRAIVEIGLGAYSVSTSS